MILYQEQVMQIVQVLAGFTLGQADILRRAMGKKKHDVLMSQKENFLKGAKDNGVDDKLAETILIYYYILLIMVLINLTVLLMHSCHGEQHI